MQTVESDSWAKLAAIGTLVAVLLAGWAIVQAYRARTDADNGLQRERRLDFELDLLKEIADYFARPNPWREWHPYIRSRLALLPGDDLQTLRSYYLDGDVSSDRWDELGLDDVTVGEEEIKAAVQARLHQR